MGQNLLQGTGFFDAQFWGGYRSVGLGDYDSVHYMAQIIGSGSASNFIQTPMSGRNLLLNTNNFANLSNWGLNKGSAVSGTIGLATDPTYGSVIQGTLTTNATSGSNWWLIQGTGITLPNKQFTIGQSYTVSFMVQNDIPLYLTFTDSNGLNPVTSNYSIPVSSTWQKIVYTFTANATGNVPEFYLAKNSNTATGNVFLTQVKLETGSAPTPWTPAPEDGNTPINQGLVLQTGTTYTASVYAKSPSGSNKLGITLEASKIDYQEQPLATGWMQLSWTFTGDSGTSGLQNFRFESSTASSSNPVYITMPKIELGTVATPWAPYPGEESGVIGMNIVASGQITLVDLNDAKSLTSYITSTSPRIQIYDNHASTYTPNWSTSNVTLVPNLFLTGSSTAIIGNAKSVTWDKDGTTITSGSGGYTIAASNATNPFALTIAQNILTTASPNGRYNCTIVWTDTTFNVDVTSICSIDFALAQNGTGGVSSVLSNDAAIVATLADGSGGVYGGANLATTASVYVGGSDDSANWSFSQALSGCTVTASNSNRTATVTNMTSDNATVTFTATRSGYPTQTLVFALSKSKQGATPTTYWVMVDNTAIKQSAAGVNTPSSINITGMSQVGTNAPSSFTSRVKIETSPDGSTWTIASQSTFNASADTTTWPLNYPLSNVPGGTKSIRISLYLAGGTTTLVDQQIANILVDGSNTLTCYLTNDSATIATDQAGANGVYTGTNTDIHVFDGTQEVIYDGTGTANGTWKVTSVASGVTAGTLTDSGNYASYGVVSNITADQATVTYTITGKGYSGQAISFTKVQSFSRAKTGVAPTSYWSIIDNKAINKDINSVYTPNSFNITGKSQTGGGAISNYNGRVKVEYSTDGTTYNVSANSKYNATADTTVWPLNVPTTDAPANVVSIRVSLYASGGTTTLLDQDIINIVSDGATGAPAILAYCWAPSGTVVRNNSGSITAECDLYVGSTLTTSGVTYQWYKFVTGTPDQGGGAGWLKLASGSDGGGTTGWTTNTLTIPAGAIASMDTYKCIASYSSKTYTDMITVQDQSDPIQLTLIADTGTAFKNGLGANKNITCHVYQAGNELDTNGTLYTYEWTMRDANGNVDPTFVDFTIANPSAQASNITTATTGGSLTAATYYVKYTWVTSFGETQASPERSIVVPTGTSTNTITVTLPAFPANVTSANIYISTATGTETKQGSTATTTYTQTAALVAGSGQPSSNTASATYMSGKTIVVTPANVTNIGNLVCSIWQ